MAAVAHPDKSTIVAKITPYIQNVPNSKNLRALHAASPAEGEPHASATWLFVRSNECIVYVFVLRLQMYSFSCFARFVFSVVQQVSHASLEISSRRGRLRTAETAQQVVR